MEIRDRLLLRLPVALKEKIESCAKANLRSVTREIELAVTNHVASMQGKQS